MKKWKTTTRMELIALMMVSILIPTLLVNLFYCRQMNLAMEEKLLSYQKEIVQESSDEVQQLISQINVTTRQLIAISVTSDMYKRYDEKTPSEKLATVKSLQGIMRSIVFSVSYHAGTYYIGTDGSVFSNLNSIHASDLLANVGEEENGVPFDAQYYSNEQSVRVIPFLTEIQSFDNYNVLQRIGIELQYSDLDNIYDKYEADTVETFIVNTQNKLIYAKSNSDYPWEQYIGQELPEAELQYIDGLRSTNRAVVSRLTGIDWEIVSAVNPKMLTTDRTRTNRYLIVILLGTVCFSIFFSYLVSQQITNPLRKLVHKMRAIGENEKYTDRIHTRNSDIMELSDSFDIMLTKIERLNAINSQKEKEKVNMQLKALQSQINPHFLYNTLENIRSIALEHNITSIEEMTKALSEIFRYSISSKNVVTVREELDHIRNYGQILQYRFGERLNILYFIDEAIKDCLIMKFILQPVIENAISHGVEPKSGAGVVTVIGSVEQGKIQIRVIDNGIGMKPEELQQVQENLKLQREPSGQRGIGLINVDMRLKLYYGDAYGVKIESLYGEGTQVTIELPYMREDENTDAEITDHGR